MLHSRDGKILRNSSISTHHYLKYIQERLAFNHLTIGFDEVRFLQDRLQNIPEGINIVCGKIANPPQRDPHYTAAYPIRN